MLSLARRPDRILSIVMFSACALIIGSAQADGVILRHKDVFTCGQSKPEGYRQFRLPSIVIHGDVVIIFAEGRENSRNDPGSSDSIDIAYKRSEDGGLTWSSLKLLADGTSHYPGNTHSNTAYQPTTVMDVQDGYQRIYVFYNRAQTRPFYRYSDDLGLTWSTEFSFREMINNRPAQFSKLSVNLASGVQMQDGKLVVPMNTILQGDPAGQIRPSVAYSDNHGETWHYGGHSAPGANEHQITEIFSSCGSMLYSSSRRDGREVKARRVNYGVFNDNTGQWKWGTDITPIDANSNKIRAFPISAAIERYTRKGVNGEAISRLLFILPQGRNSSGELTNTDLSVFVSTDEGISYNLPKVLFHGKAGYSDIATVDGDLFLTAWERGESENAEFITLTTANRDFLYENTACRATPHFHGPEWGGTRLTTTVVP